MVISWPDFYADHDGINSFWKFLDFAQNYPIYKFDTFWANISAAIWEIWILKQLLRILIKIC